jgi:hypothetical protein
VSVTARASHARALFGLETEPFLRYLSDKQAANGSWDDDPWNVSWLYLTCHVVSALVAAKSVERLAAPVRCLIAEQCRDGGWGVGRESTPIETAWGALALHKAVKGGAQAPGADGALARAHAYLGEWYRSGARMNADRWIGRDAYSAMRVDRVFTLGTLAALERSHVA